MAAVLWLCLLAPDLPAGSLSGEELAYVRLSEGYWQVWVLELGPGRHRQLTTSAFDKRYPTWGRGGEIVFRSNNDRLYRVDSRGDEERAFHSDAWPAVDPRWSPDRERIAIARMRTDIPDASAIWVKRRGAASWRVLTRGPGLHFQPTWSPDGHWIAYVRTEGALRSTILRVSLEQGAPRILVEHASRNLHPAWAPEGGLLAFASTRSGNFDIWLRDLATEQERALTTAPGLDTRPAWSPDGERIAFTTLRRGRHEIWVMRADGDNQRPLFEVDEEVSDPAWHRGTPRPG